MVCPVASAFRRKYSFAEVLLQAARPLNIVNVGAPGAEQAYGDRVSLRRALLVALTAWVAGVTAASAAPCGFHAHQSRRLSTITFSPFGSGTAIRITYAGRVRPLVGITGAPRG